MLNRIKILTMLQLGNKVKMSNNKSKKMIALRIFLMFILFCGITAGIYFVLGFIKSTLYLPINKGMLTFVLFITQIFSIVSTTNALMNSLYASKDNAILLAYPANHNEVFISKLVVEYVRELKKSLFFLLPMLIAFGVVSGAGIWYFIFSLVLLFILPLFPVLIGAVLSIPLAFIKKLVDKVPILYLVMVIALVVCVFLLLNSFLATIPRPLRIIAIYNKFVNGVTSFIVAANQYALYCTLFTNILYSINTLLNLLFIILIVAGAVLLVYFLSMPFYFNLASFSREHSVKKIKQGKNSKQRATFWAFLKKEILLTFRNINQVMSNYVLIIIAPIILYTMNVVFSAILTSALGDSMIIAFNIIVGGVLILASNTQSATAITSEGSEIVLMKTAPSNTANMVWAKLFVNIVVSTLLIIVSAIILIASNIMSVGMVVGIFTVLIFINWGHIMWSLQLDIVKPNLREYAETGRTDGQNVGLSMTLGLIVTLVMGVITLFLFFDSYSTSWPKVILIALAFFAIRLYFLIINVKTYFKRIEY